MKQGKILQTSPSKYGPGLRLCIQSSAGDDWLTLYDPLPAGIGKGSAVVYEIADDEKGRPYIASIRSATMDSRPHGAAPPAPPAAGGGQSYDPVQGSVLQAASAGGTRDQWIATQAIFRDLLTASQGATEPRVCLARALNYVLFASDVFTAYQGGGRKIANAMISQWLNPRPATAEPPAEPARGPSLQERAEGIADKYRDRHLAPPAPDFDDDIPF